MLSAGWRQLRGQYTPCLLYTSVQRGVVKLSHQESITKDPKTTSGDRMVYLSKEMCQLLKAWRKECEWDRQQTANETVHEDDYDMTAGDGINRGNAVQQGGFARAGSTHDAERCV